MTTITVPKKEYQQLLDRALRYEYLRQLMEGDIFSPPPAKTAGKLLKSFKNTELYNQEFLKAQESIGETVDYNGFFLSETPIRFFAFIVEELSATKKEFNLITNFNVK